MGATKIRVSDKKRTWFVVAVAMTATTKVGVNSKKEKLVWPWY